MPTGIEGVMVEGGRGGRCHPVGGFAEGRRSVGLTLEMTHRRRVKIPPPNLEMATRLRTKPRGLPRLR